MLRSRLSRIGLLIALAGFAVLGASFYNWTQASPDHRLFSTKDEHEWVRADSSSARAVESDETWQVSAACLGPYLATAAEQAGANLKTYDDTAPDEIRAWRNRPPEQQQSDQQQSRPQEGQTRLAQSDDEIKLQTKYQDWFLAEFRLEKQLKQWERRLGSVTDRSTSLGDARRRIMDVRLYLSEDTELASAGRDFEHFVFFLLGLGGFPDDQLKAIKVACIDVIPIKRIVTTTTWHTDIRRWPADHAAAFWPGLALAVVGLLLIPIATRMSATK